MAVIKSGGGGIFGTILKVAGMMTGNPWLMMGGDLANGNMLGALTGGMSGLSGLAGKGLEGGAALSPAIENPAISNIASAAAQPALSSSSFANLDPLNVFGMNGMENNIIKAPSIFEDIERIRANNAILSEQNSRAGDTRFTSLLDVPQPVPMATQPASINWGAGSVNPGATMNDLWATPESQYNSRMAELDPYNETILQRTPTGQPLWQGQNTPIFPALRDMIRSRFGW